MANVQRSSVEMSPTRTSDGRCEATYGFENAQLREVMKGSPVTVLDQADYLNKFLEIYDIELVSIGIPEYDPSTKKTEQEITLCAKNSQSLKTALEHLNDLGLAFKKRANKDWISRVDPDPKTESNAPMRFIQFPKPGRARAATSAVPIRSPIDNKDIFDTFQVKPRRNTGNRITSMEYALVENEASSVGSVVNKASSISAIESKASATNASEVKVVNGSNTEDTKTNSELEWSENGSDSINKNVYQVPQRRMSDTSKGPKLSVDIAAANSSRSSYKPYSGETTNDHCKATVPGTVRMFTSAGTPSMDMENPHWGPHTGSPIREYHGQFDEINQFLAYGNAQFEDKETAVPASAVSSTYTGSFPAIHSNVATASNSSNRRLPYSDQSFNMNGRHFEKEHMCFENNNPQMNQNTGFSGNSRGYAGRVYDSQRFQKPNFHSRFNGSAQGRPTETTIYAMQNIPGESCQKDVYGVDSSFCYYLKPPPMTGPRFIR